MNAALRERIAIQPRCSEPLTASWTRPAVEPDSSDSKESHPDKGENEDGAVSVEHRTAYESQGTDDRYVPEKGKQKQIPTLPIFVPLLLEGAHVFRTELILPGSFDTLRHYACNSTKRVEIRLCFSHFSLLLQLSSLSCCQSSKHSLILTQLVSLTLCPMANHNYAIHI